MKETKRILTFFTLVAVLTPVVWTLSGNREGNGGDHIRSTFIKTGHSVIQHLRTSDAGSAIVQAHNLDVEALEAGLDIERITVVEGPLIDNGGSDVEALGEPGKITLQKDSWYEHFEKERDVYYLVFHELLRSAGINDDNYVISAAMDPFPSTSKVVTRIASLIPLIAMDDVTPFLPKSAKEIVLAGVGCPDNSLFLDLDKERGVLDLSFKKYLTSGKTARAQCDLRMPVKTNAMSRLIISQIDMSGRLSLPAGSSASIVLRPNLGTTLGPQTRKVVSARSEGEHGRFSLRTNPNFATPCEDNRSLLGLNTNVTLMSPEEAASVRVDRVSVYFRVESCSPGSGVERRN